MTETRARMLPAEGPAAVFDPADPGPFAALAGERLVAVTGEAAVVRTQGGDLLTVRQGWVVIVPDGEGPVFCTPEQAEVLPG